MGKGRKAHAVEVKEANGTYRKDPQRRNPDAPMANGQEPKMPDYFGDDARQKWVELINDLRSMGVLSSDCRELMVAYCTAYEEWLKCRRIVAQQGMTVGSSTGEKRNPVLTDLHKHRETMNKLLPEFGLTPSSRGKLKSFKEKEDDPFDSFLARMTGKN